MGSGLRAHGGKLEAQDGSRNRLSGLPGRFAGFAYNLSILGETEAQKARFRIALLLSRLIYGLYEGYRRGRGYGWRRSGFPNSGHIAHYACAGTRARKGSGFRSRAMRTKKRPTQA